MTPNEARRISFRLCPETCKDVRAALDEAVVTIMEDLDVPAHDVATVDAPISRAFCLIRERSTGRLRSVLCRVLETLTNEQGKVLIGKLMIGEEPEVKRDVRRSDDQLYLEAP